MIDIDQCREKVKLEMTTKKQNRLWRAFHRHQHKIDSPLAKAMIVYFENRLVTFKRLLKELEHDEKKTRLDE